MKIKKRNKVVCNLYERKVYCIQAKNVKNFETSTKPLINIKKCIE